MWVSEYCADPIFPDALWATLTWLRRESVAPGTDDVLGTHLLRTADLPKVTETRSATVHVPPLSVLRKGVPIQLVIIISSILIDDS